MTMLIFNYSGKVTLTYLTGFYLNSTPKIYVSTNDIQNIIERVLSRDVFTVKTVKC